MGALANLISWNCKILFTNGRIEGSNHQARHMFLCVMRLRAHP